MTLHFPNLAAPIAGKEPITPAWAKYLREQFLPTRTTADIADSTNARYCTDAQKTVLGNTSGTNSGNETTTTAGTLVDGATAKTTPVDADNVAITDSAASHVLKKLTWANLKSTLKTYFDGLYAVTAKGVTNGDSHDHNGGDGAQVNHTTLANIGTSTHAAIDTHIADLGVHTNGLVMLTDSTARTYTAGTWYTIGAAFPVDLFGTWAVMVNVQYDGTNYHQHLGSCILSALWWKASGTQGNPGFWMEQHSGNDFTGYARFAAGQANRAIEITFSANVVVWAGGCVTVVAKKLI